MSLAGFLLVLVTLLYPPRTATALEFETVVREGDDVSDLPGRIVVRLNDARAAINDAGTVAFAAITDFADEDQKTANSFVNGIWRLRDGVDEAVALKNQSAPGGGSYGDSHSMQSINNQDSVLFSAQLQPSASAFFPER